METLNFLSKTINTMNKDEAIEKLCVVIQSYFPDTCQICNQSYRSKIHDSSLLKCGSCGQEVHQPCYLKLLKNMNLIDQDEKLRDLIYQMPGMFYLCQHCQENTINFPHKTTTEDVNNVNVNINSAQTPTETTNTTKCHEPSKTNTCTLTCQKYY